MNRVRLYRSSEGGRFLTSDQIPECCPGCPFEPDGSICEVVRSDKDEITGRRPPVTSRSAFCQSGAKDEKSAQNEKD